MYSRNFHTGTCPLFADEALLVRIAEVMGDEESSTYIYMAVEKKPVGQDANQGRSCALTPYVCILEYRETYGLRSVIYEESSGDGCFTSRALYAAAGIVTTVVTTTQRSIYTLTSIGRLWMK